MVDSVGELVTKVCTSLIQVALQISSILRRPPGQHQSQLGARLVATLRVLIVGNHWTTVLPVCGKTHHTSTMMVNFFATNHAWPGVTYTITHTTQSQQALQHKPQIAFDAGRNMYCRIKFIRWWRNSGIKKSIVPNLITFANLLQYSWGQ